MYSMTPPPSQHRGDRDSHSLECIQMFSVKILILTVTKSLHAPAYFHNIFWPDNG